MRECDIAVLGGGLAGLTAGMIAAQHGLSVVIVDQMGAAGQVLNVERIDNMPGFPDGVPGYELGPIVQAQAEAAGCEFAFDTVTALESDGEGHVLRCADEDVRGRAVIVAVGSSFRRLGIPGEERFEGRGVSHCAGCDGPFHVGKTVAVIGGGDSAIQEAAVLAQFAGRILVFNRGPELTAQHLLLERAGDHAQIEVYANTEVQQILGEDTVESLQVHDITSGTVRDEAVTGVFTYVGLEPNTAFLQGVVELDGGGHVVTDINMATSMPGVFAAGDVRQGSVALVASVIGDGATAAVSAYRYLRG